MEMVLQQRACVGVSMMSAADGGGVAAPMMAKQEDDDEQEEELLQQKQRAAAGDELLRRGPWTVDEDLTLINYIADHGEGRWNALARAAGLKRTGKSCRLRWLNYLRPDVKRGDFTADEQLLILDLHSRWGNRWSKIAAQLPGRTDNEIKNYWRTRVQKHAKQLNCDVNSSRFKDAMRFLWMPRLAERAKLAASTQHHHQQHLQLSPSPDMATAVPPSSSRATLIMAVDTVSNSCSCSPSSAVTTTTTTASSSSCSSLTSESTATTHAAATVEPAAAVLLTDDDYWGGGATAMTTTAMQQQQNDDQYDFWSTASALQNLTAAGDHHHHHQFQQVAAAAADEQDLTGWVQGFSDGGGILSSSENLWSLDDIWRMH